MTYSRRAFLGAGAAAATLPLVRAEAAAPFVGRGAPAWYRFRFGEFEATVVSDGALPLGKAEDAFVGARPGALLVPSLLGGAVIVLAADILVRLTPAAGEVKLGVAMAALGAPFFLVLLLRLRRRIA